MKQKTDKLVVRGDEVVDTIRQLNRSRTRIVSAEPKGEDGYLLRLAPRRQAAKARGGRAGEA